MTGGLPEKCLVVTCNHVTNKFQPGAAIDVWFEATRQARVASCCGGAPSAMSPSWSWPARPARSNLSS
jgi:hypothetical protein